MSELQSLRDAARTADQLSGAIAAEVKRGELMRFYVEQVESAHVNEFGDGRSRQGRGRPTGSALAHLSAV